LRVEVLSLEPLPSVPTLHIAYRYVVRAGVAEDVPHRVRFRDVATALADHDRQLGLPIELLRVRRGEQHCRFRPDHGRRVLGEERRKLRDLLRRELRTGLAPRLLSFLEVLAVIPTHAEDVPRWARDRSKKLRGLERNAVARAARRSPKLCPELVAGKQQVEDIVLIGRAA